MPKILVLGSTGMLGHMVSQVLSQEKNWDVMGTQSRQPDAPGFFNVEQGVETLGQQGKHWDYVINCIGIKSSEIKDSDSASIARAIRINALFPHELALWAQATGTRIIHISTDGVFSGTGGPYDEGAPTDAPDVYGKTKALGEAPVSTALTIRTSIIGPSPFKKEGLWEWFCAQPDQRTVQGYTNHAWHGVTTLQFAQLCHRIIAREYFDALRKEASVFHFAPNHAVTKYEFLCLLRDALQKSIIIEPVEHPSGPVSRILATRYQGIKEIYPHDIPMEKAIKEMVSFSS